MRIVTVFALLLVLSGCSRAQTPLCVPASASPMEAALLQGVDNRAARCGQLHLSEPDLTLEIRALAPVTLTPQAAIAVVMTHNRGWMGPQDPLDWVEIEGEDGFAIIDWLWVVRDEAGAASHTRSLRDAVYVMARSEDGSPAYLRCTGGVCEHWLWVERRDGTGAVLALSYAWPDDRRPDTGFVRIEAAARAWYAEQP